MQALEILFLLIFAASIVLYASRRYQARLPGLTIVLAGILAVAAGAFFEGWRWQMLPGQFGFALLALALINGRRAQGLRGALSAGAAILLLGTSALLAHQLPLRSLPEPTGPYAVGTFEYSVTDTARVERFAPERNRELYVEVWYPAARDSVEEYPVESLYHELYEGERTIWSTLFGYLRLIPTHSHVRAPIAVPTGTDESYPVLLFNHGLDGFTSQNLLLMEHLASHGYVVFSIAHPYRSIRVNLADAGTVRAGTSRPSDVGVPPLQTDLLTKIREMHDGWEGTASVRGMLFGLANAVGAASEESERNAIVRAALETRELEPYRHLMTDESLSHYLQFLYFDQGRAIEYWVEDIQFIADRLGNLSAPVDGFTEALDVDRLGVFGMSMGGAAAGEFCKIDARCRAGANIDGTQGGRHWNVSVGAPFMMIYHEEHRAGNDFAYLPPAHDFRDLTVAGTTHLDFVDLALTMPLLKTLGLAGPIDARRTIEILNEVNLDFFDRYLKGLAYYDDVYAGFPEIEVREHEVAAVALCARNDNTYLQTVAGKGASFETLVDLAMRSAKRIDARRGLRVLSDMGIVEGMAFLAVEARQPGGC